MTSSTTGPAGRFIAWLGIHSSKFYHWIQRYGKANEHNAWIPRDHWLEESEKQAILDFELRYPLEGYRRLVSGYVQHYNTVRLHSAIGYITPADKLAGREQAIFAALDRKFEEARQQRAERRQQAQAA